jgi:hypothetical protein
MGHLLKAMGFWVWGLIVIGLSITMVSVNYRAAFWHAQLSPDLGSGNRAEIDHQFARSIDPASVVDSTTNSPGGYLTMAEIYYKEKDCARAVVWSDKAVAAFGATSRESSETAYKIKLQCASDARNPAAMIATLDDLVRLTNKTQYWNTLIRLVRSDLRDDRNVLLTYRVMYAVDAMGIDTDYIEMAQLLADAGQPAEAQTVLEKAVRSGIVKDEHMARVTRLLEKDAARVAALQSAPAVVDQGQIGLADTNIAPQVVELQQLYAEARR